MAPSNELRKWYPHEATKWPEFQESYFAELDANPEGVAQLRAELSRGLNTVVFASKEQERNNAIALIVYLRRLR